MGKRENIIEYITALPAGTKVSVRNLAKDLGVSEGTAYKAIKQAEELQLVETRPRAGTVRLQTDIFADAQPVTLGDEIGRLGLSVLAGEEFANVPIGRIVIGDGSLDQFKAGISAAGENPLCIVGDRPDLLFFAASSGVNTILTNGTQPGEALLETAAEHKACILSSLQDGSVILNLLRADAVPGGRAADPTRAGQWMRTPPYLYYNDIVADWYGAYRPIFSMSARCAVVDDNLHICGSIDAARALASSPSVKISNLYSDEDKLFFADEDTPISDIAQYMISNDSSIAYITRGGMLCGVVTSSDVLRCYQFSSSSVVGAARAPRFEKLSSDARRIVYTAQLDSSQNGSTDVMLGIINIAAQKFCQERFGKDCAFTSGTFYTKAALVPCELMISCEIQQAISSEYILELEMYNETTSFAHCVTVVSVGDQQQCD